MYQFLYFKEKMSLSLIHKPKIHLTLQKYVQNNTNIISENLDFYRPQQ